MYSRCPKCGHRPLPPDQSLPAACPGCGVILAKIAAMPVRGMNTPGPAAGKPGIASAIAACLMQVPAQVDPAALWGRVALLVGLGWWGLRLILLDYRDGAICASFIHAPLLVFHEAGHVLFRPFGEWLTVLGGTLGQLLMPTLLGGALLWKNRDPFGAAVGLWLLGVSLLDVAPYMYDALEPQLMLTSGTTGEEGGHDWIYLFSSLGLLGRSQAIGGLTHALGALTLLLALAWAAALLHRQGRHLGSGLREED
jgi:hypothetical protein